MKRTMLIFSVVLFTIGIASAQRSTSKLAADPLFQKNCAKCHGKTAQGRRFAGPSLVSGKASAISPDDLRNVISNGKHRMPEFGSKLSPDEINTLVSEMTRSSQQ